MKLRIYRQTIRLRLSGQELEELAQTGTLEDSCLIPQSESFQSFSYCLVRGDGRSASHLRIEPFRWVFSLNPTDSDLLQLSHQEGVEIHQQGTIGEGAIGHLKILIEKDRFG